MGRESADSGNTEKIETLLTSAHNAEINSLDDAINVIDMLLPLMVDNDEIDDMHNVLGDVLTHFHEMKKDIGDDADTE